MAQQILQTPLNNDQTGGAIVAGTTPITSAVLNPQSAINYATPQQPPIPAVDYSTRALQVTQPEQQANDLTTRLQDLNSQLVGQSSYQTQQEQAAGIADLQTRQNDLNAQLKQLQAESQAIPQQLQLDATGRGITAGGLQPIQTAALRNNAIKALGTSALLDATNGLLASAQQKVDRAVKAKFDPIQEQIDAATKNLNLILNSPQYSLADKNRAQAQLDIQNQKQQQLAQQKQDQANVYNIALEAAKNGADASTLQKIQNSGSPQEAIQNAGTFLQTPPGTSIVEANGRKLLINTNTGQTVKDLGAATSAAGTVLGGTQSQAESVAQGIMNGTIPPDLTKNVSFKDRTAVNAYLSGQGYNLTKATEDWTAIQKRISTLNGQQQVRLGQAVSFAKDSLSLVDQLNAQWQGGQFPLLNKANLALAKNGAFGQDAQSLATRLEAQINDLVSELGTVYKGGNSSTDESLKLASANLNANWSQKTLQDAVNLIRTNLQIRENSIKQSGMIEGNQYSPEAPPTASAQVGQTVTAANGLPDGTQVKGDDGKAYVVRNGQFVSQ